jgi:hypothetical protein
MELGWDRNREKPKEKHYRKWYNKPLEDVSDVFEDKPFTSESIKRGQQRGADDDATFGSWSRMFSKVKYDDSGEVDTEKEVGQFIGLVTVSTEQYEDIYSKTKVKYISKIYDELCILYRNEMKIPGIEFPFEKDSFIISSKEKDHKETSADHCPSK